MRRGPSSGWRVTRVTRTEDLEAAHRYRAARASAMAGAGKGQYPPPLDEHAKARCRQQALGWLQAGLTVRTKQLESRSRQAENEVSGALQGWKLDLELAGVREDEAVSGLPQPEQKACRALRAEVDKVLKVKGAGSPKAARRKADRGSSPPALVARPSI